MKLPGTLACFPRLLAVDLGRVECQLQPHWLHNTALPQDQDCRREEEHAVAGDRPTKELSQVRAHSAGTCGGSSSGMVWNSDWCWDHPRLVPTQAKHLLSPSCSSTASLWAKSISVGSGESTHLEGKKQTCIQASGLLLQQLEPYSHPPGRWCWPLSRGGIQKNTLPLLWPLHL